MSTKPWKSKKKKNQEFELQGTVYLAAKNISSK